MSMTSNQPYIVRAFYDWIEDNKCRAYIVVDANFPKTIVPKKYVKNGQIVLDISSQAVKELKINNDKLVFLSRFDGVVIQISLPIESIMAIYALENGQGVVFRDQPTQANEKSVDNPLQQDDVTDQTDDTKNNKNSNADKRSHLKVIK